MSGSRLIRIRSSHRTAPQTGHKERRELLELCDVLTYNGPVDGPWTQLAAFRLTAPGINVKDFELSLSDYFTFHEQSTTFQDIGMYQGDSVSVTGMAEPERVDALIVTDGMLPILGIPLLLGARAQQNGRFSGRPQYCDMYSTLARAAGAEIPKDRPIDGVDQLDFFLGKQETSNREGFPAYLAERLYTVKWRNWKMHLVWQVNMYDPPVTLPLPRIINLLTDPREKVFGS